MAFMIAMFCRVRAVSEWLSHGTTTHVSYTLSKRCTATDNSAAAHDSLQLWLGPGIAEPSWRLDQWLGIAMSLVGLSKPPV